MLSFRLAGTYSYVHFLKWLVSYFLIMEKIQNENLDCLLLF